MAYEEFLFRTLADSATHLHYYATTVIAKLCSLSAEFTVLLLYSLYVTLAGYIYARLWIDTETEFLFVQSAAALVMTARYGTSRLAASGPSTGHLRVMWKNAC